MTLALLPFIGFLAGFLVISFGGGGGGIYVGVLTALCDIPPAIAASTSLATVIPTAAVGALGYCRAGCVDFRLAATLLVNAVIGIVGGTYSSTFLSDQAYYFLSGTLLIAVSIQTLVSSYLQKERAFRADGAKLTGREILTASAFGLLSGLMTGAVGLSGGGLITAALFQLRCPALRTVGTSVAVIAAMSLVSFLLHLSAGHVDWMLILCLASGTITGAAAAPYCLARLGKDRAEKIVRPLIIAVNSILGVLILLK